MTEDEIEALTQERSDVKREIKRWVQSFKKTHGRPPNTEDKEAVLNLYERYSELERLLNEATAEVAAEAPESPDVSRRKIAELESKIQQLETENEKLALLTQNSVAHQADAKTLLSLTTQVCKQRAAGEERLARSELGCMQLKQHAVQADKSVAEAQRETKEQTAKLEETLARITALEQEQERGINIQSVGASEGELQAELDCTKLECETLQATALREARERHQER